MHGEWFYPDADVAAEANALDEVALHRVTIDAAVAILEAGR
jgi:hypothetical protein